MSKEEEIEQLFRSEANRDFEKEGQEFLITQMIYEGEWVEQLTKTKFRAQKS